MYEIKLTFTCSLLENVLSDCLQIYRVSDIDQTQYNVVPSCYSLRPRVCLLILPKLNLSGVQSISEVKGKSRGPLFRFIDLD